MSARHRRKQTTRRNLTSAASDIVRARARAMLIAGARVKDIARAVGVHPDTVSHWRSEPEFKAALEEAQKDVVSRAKNVLVRAAEEAVEQVLACMREGAEDQRLRAALAIL
ncbi:helix-turn-helix domain-containing protein, partial [Myxococcota bacterium]|nr:helix-turn-helix domain-containing protein [Myxococcota bacterium]